MGQIPPLFPIWPHVSVAYIDLKCFVGGRADGCMHTECQVPQAPSLAGICQGWCAPSSWSTGASVSSNAECCLGFQQCPCLWSFKKVKPLTRSWLRQRRMISGAIHCLLWYPHGQRRFCSNESLLLTTSWSVKDGLPLLIFVWIVAIISQVNVAENILRS